MGDRRERSEWVEAANFNDSSIDCGSWIAPDGRCSGIHHAQSRVAIGIEFKFGQQSAEKTIVRIR